MLLLPSTRPSTASSLRKGPLCAQRKWPGVLSFWQAEDAIDFCPCDERVHAGAEGVRGDRDADAGTG